MANLAGEDHLLISEDMHYRQFAAAACAAKGLWLQEIFSFAHESGIVDHQRYSELVVRLAGRRHGHLALNPDIMLAVLRDDATQGLENFRSIAKFIGTQSAEIQSHIAVSTEFLNQIWRNFGRFYLRCMQATSIILEQIIRFRRRDWALVLAFIKRGCAPLGQEYIDRWIVGHFLSASAVSDAAAEIENTARGLRTHRDV